MKKVAICMILLIDQAWALSCTAPVTFSEPGQNVGWPKMNVVMNEQGEALITWNLRDSDTGENKLVAATMNAEKKWSTATVSDSGKYIFDKKIFVDASGNNLAFWELTKEDYEGSTSRFYQFAKQEKNQAWSPPVNVLDQEEIRDTYPKRAFDSQGNLVIFGIKEVKDQKDTWRTNKRVVAVNYSPQKGQKKETEISNPESEYPSAELLVRNKNDNFFALWTENTFTCDAKIGDVSEKTMKGSWFIDNFFALWTENTSTYDAKVGYVSEKAMKGSWFNGDAGWSIPEKVFPAEIGNSFSNFKGIMNGNKDMVIIWNRNGGTDSLHKVQALTYLDGQWSEPFDLFESKESIYSLHLSLSMNEKGHIAASWQKTQKGKKVVWIAEKPAGQPWSSPIALTDPSKKSDFSKLHIDEEGNIFVLWMTREGRNDVACFAEKPVGQPWSSPIVLTDPSKDVIALDMKRDKQRNTLIVWTYREGRKKIPHVRDKLRDGSIVRIHYKEGRKEVPYAIYRPANQAWASPVCLLEGLRFCDGYSIKVKATNLGHFVVIWNGFGREDLSSIQGAVLSTSTGEWSSAMLSPEGQNCDDFSFKLNDKGQGIIAWSVENDKDRYIQVAELNVN